MFTVLTINKISKKIYSHFLDQTSLIGEVLSITQSHVIERKLLGCIR